MGAGGGVRVAAEMDAKTSGYQPYLDAAWGLKNHWYPAAFSHEVPDKLIKGVTICGREIALRRAKGKVHALSDRCAHRGVRISAKSICPTDEHLTCWYHGFSYGLEDGLLKTVLASPGDPRIGQIGIRTYPVEECGGIIYVFVGDAEYDPPLLASDLPIRITDEPDAIGHLLDKNVYIQGIHRTAACNWRLAMENGFDSGHPLIHYETPLIVATDRALGLGWAPTGPDAIRIIDEPDGPKGMMNMFRTGQFRVFRENALAEIKVYGQTHHYARTSIYLPCCLLVENWPIKGWGQYEWCVPIDDKSHEYWEVLVGPGANEEEIRESEFKFVNFLEPLGLWGFNDPDVFAREAVEEFYAKMDGWEREQLCQFDSVLIAWRKLVSQYNRGIIRAPQDRR